MGVPVYLLAWWGVAGSPVGLVGVVALGVLVYFVVALATRRQIYARVKRIASIAAVR